MMVVMTSFHQHLRIPHHFEKPNTVNSIASGLLQCPLVELTLLTRIIPISGGTPGDGKMTDPGDEVAVMLTRPIPCQTTTERLTRLEDKG